MDNKVSLLAVVLVVAGVVRVVKHLAPASDPAVSAPAPANAGPPAPPPAPPASTPLAVAPSAPASAPAPRTPPSPITASSSRGAVDFSQVEDAAGRCVVTCTSAKDAAVRWSSAKCIVKRGQVPYVSNDCQYVLVVDAQPPAHEPWPETELATLYRRDEETRILLASDVFPRRGPWELTREGQFAWLAARREEPAAAVAYSSGREAVEISVRGGGSVRVPLADAPPQVLVTPTSVEAPVAPPPASNVRAPPRPSVTLPDTRGQDDDQREATWRARFRAALARISTLEAEVAAKRRELTELNVADPKFRQRAVASMHLENCTKGADGRLYCKQDIDALAMMQVRMEAEALQKRIDAANEELVAARESLRGLERAAANEAVPLEWRK